MFRMLLPDPFTDVIIRLSQKTETQEGEKEGENQIILKRFVLRKNIHIYENSVKI